jgi:hypothetical protein
LWHSSLTKGNRNELERTQNFVCKLVLKERYINYENSLMKLKMISFEQRRQQLCKISKLDDLFPTIQKEQLMKMRETEKYAADFANAERLKRGSIINIGAKRGGTWEQCS